MLKILNIPNSEWLLGLFPFEAPRFYDKNVVLLQIRKLYLLSWLIDEGGTCARPGLRPTQLDR